MKKKLALLAVFILLSVLALAACGKDGDVQIDFFSDDTFEYAIMLRKSDDTKYAKVIGYVGPNEVEPTDVTPNAEIPAAVTVGETSYKVTAVEKEAFSGKSPTCIVAGENVSEINDFAFSNCGATKIVLPKAAERIGAYAFADCRFLRVVELEAEKPPKLGENAFKIFVAGKYQTSAILVVKVPKNALKEYQSANSWKEYVTILRG